MASEYQGYVLADAFADKIALYERGTFLGHFLTESAAKAFVDHRMRKHAEQQP